MPAITESVRAALVTPRREGAQEADIGQVFEVLDFLASRRVPGVVLMGATGEFPHYAVEDRTRLASFVLKRSRVPVLVNASHSTLDGAVVLGQQAVRSGAAGLLVMPPHFFRYGPGEVEAFLREFARQVRGVPLYLYHLPAFTSEIAPDTATRLLGEGLYAGIKDSSGDAPMLAHLAALAATGVTALFVGNDRLLAEGRRQGAQGVISGVACALPELILAADQAVMAGDSPRSDRLVARLREFLDWIDAFPTPQGVKEALALRGVKMGPPAAPLGPTALQRQGEFRSWFPGWWAEVLRECA